MKKLIGSFLLFIGFATTAMAETDPSAHLSKMADDMINIIKQNQEALKTDSSLAEKLVRKHLLPAIDTQTFARKTIGTKRWKTLNDTQKKQFVDGFINMVVKKYAKGLSLFDGQSFEFEKAEFSKKNPNAARVKSSLKQAGEQPLSINYIVSKKSGKWLITNLIVEGTNMRKSYKQQFAPRIKEIGIDKFIEELNAPEKK